MATNTEINVADQAFAESFAAKLEATAPVAVPAPEPAAPPAAAAAEDPTPAKASDSAPAATESGAETETKDTTIVGDAADDPATESDDDADDAAEETAPDPDTVAFTAALERLGVDVKVDDVPAEARPLVLAKFKQLEAGFTKARQKDTETLVQLRAEQRVITERPDDYIVALVLKDPTLADKINAKLEAAAGPTVAEAHDVVMERAREKATSAERAAVADADAQAREVEALDAHLTAALTAAKVTPGKALERMIAAAMDVAEAKHGTRTITRAEIDAIVADYAGDMQAKAQHARRLEKRRLSERAVQDKLTDRATAGLVVRPGAGSAPTPAPAAKPKTPAEFTDYFVAKLEAQQRAAAS